MSFTPRFLDEIRNRLSLSEIVGRRVRLTRAGREHKGLCPFHNEKSPSFYVNDDKQFYHCFGCGAHGDVIGFTMQHDNLSFPEAVETLAAQAGLELPKQDPKAKEQAEKAKSLHDLMKVATHWHEEQLYQNANVEALRYLDERGLDEETRRAFKIGFAPEDGQALRVYLKKLGFTDEQMLEAGILRPGKDGREPYAFFRGRIMFPVADRRGRIVAYGGRILPDHLRPPSRSDFTPPKYMNSSDTPLFHKGRMLYSESRARQAAADGAPILVVEGYMDVIACWKAGFAGAVAPLGTAITDDQITRLWQLIPGEVKTPILCFDGDNAGRRAASRAAERIVPLLKPGQSAQFIFLPDGEDPDTLLRGTGGKARFQKMIEDSTPLSEFIWQTHQAAHAGQTPESRAALQKALMDDASRIGDSIVQQHYRDMFKDKLAQAFRPPRQSFRPSPYSSKKPASPALRVSRPASKRAQMGIYILLAVLLNYPDLFDRLEEDLAALDLQNAHDLETLREDIILAHIHTPDLDSHSLKSHLSSIGHENTLNRVLTESVYIHAGFARPGGDSLKAINGWSDFKMQPLQKKIL